MPDDLDQSDDVLVELGQIRGWNPIFVKVFAACVLDRIARQKRALDLETGNIGHAHVRKNPFMRDLQREGLCENRIEYRLLGTRPGIRASRIAR